MSYIEVLPDHRIPYILLFSVIYLILDGGLRIATARQGLPILNLEPIWSLSVKVSMIFHASRQHNDNPSQPGFTLAEAYIKPQ